MGHPTKTIGNVAGSWLRRLVAPTVLSVSLIAALVVAGVASRTSRPSILVAGTNFSITSAISSSPTSTVAALLYPGTQRYLAYTVANPLSDPITVSSLTVALDPANPPPSGCGASNLDLSQANFSGTLNVAANGTNTVYRPLMLVDLNTSQDSCKGVTYHFVYSGSATYTHTFATTTTLGSSLNPSTYGQAVTFTATVAPVGTAPLPPSGSVSFVDGTTTLGSAPLNASAQASFTTSVLAGGSHSVKAVYVPSTAPADAGNFSASTSGPLSPTVNKATRTATLSSTPNPSLFGQAVTFTLSLTPSTPPVANPSGSVTFYDGGSALATVGVSNAQAQLSTSSLGGGTHTVTATYSGDGNFNGATSNPVSQQVNFSQPCITTKYNNNLTVASGQSLCITSSGSVNGNITVNPGGALFDLGGSVNGAITAKAAAGLTLCGINKINGPVSIVSSTGFVVIGDGGDDGTPSCAGNSINGDVTLSGNSGGLEIGGNSISGSVTLSSNSGTGTRAEDRAPEVEKNTMSASLNCTANNPAPINDSQPNSVKGSRTGQCAASGF